MSARRAVNVITLLGLGVVLSAHVGSPDTIFEGSAGPYPIRVIVRTPGVVPGLADISVRLTGDQPVSLITVRPVRWDAGLAGAPPPDTARLVTPEGKLYAAQLWFMASGSFSVYVDVEGAQGNGQAIVPIMAVATRRLEMNRPMAIGLIGLGLFLFVGALTIVRGAIRESVLDPGIEPDQKRRIRSWVVTAVGGAVIAALIMLGRGWWNSVDASYRGRLFRPLATTTSVRDEAGERLLRVTIAAPAWGQPGRYTPLIPDHGKLMHLFLIRTPGLDAMAHLHPSALDSTNFDSSVPPLPAGTYLVFADITLESGWTGTLPDTVEIPEGGVGRSHSDSDDGWWTGNAATGSNTADLGDGAAMTWQRPPELSSGQDTDLRFVVSGRGGGSANLEPYMGMAGHALVTREDGSVFIHLHPAGTISMAAQQAFRLRTPADSVTGRIGRRMTEEWSRAAHDHASVPDTVSFPYAFPKPGTYRIWVQVKRAGKVVTGVFDAEVN